MTISPLAKSDGGGEDVRVRRHSRVTTGTQAVLVVKNPPAHVGDGRDAGLIPELVGKIPLKKEMATHSSTPAWKIPWTERPGRPQSVGSEESQT